MSAPLLDLIGTTLTGPEGDVKACEALKDKKAVALYFSAHWCPPCRGFTPKLAEAYKEMVALGKAFEIIFVSSDREEPAFKEYFAEQPWLALPYADRDLKNKLSAKFKVSGIPSLVILDGETGKIITMDGRSAITDDPKGENFPWYPPTIWEALGTEFIKSDGESVEIDMLKGEGKVIGIYFSAHWCPPCKSFTPMLAKTYKKLKDAGKQFEIIFASSDKSMSEFQAYLGEMPWVAIPQGDQRKEMLSKLFSVEGIPTFVLIDGSTGELINANGRGAVGSDPEGAEFPWYPKPVNDLSSPEGVNETVSLCLMMEGCTVEERKSAEAVLTELAEARKAAKKEDMLFFIASSGEGPVGQIRKMTGLGNEAPSAAQLLLLDIPDQGGFYTGEINGVNAESIGTFIDSYKTKKLERKQLQ